MGASAHLYVDPESLYSPFSIRWRQELEFIQRLDGDILGKQCADQVIAAGAVVAAYVHTAAGSRMLMPRIASKERGCLADEQLHICSRSQ